VLRIHDESLDLHFTLQGSTVEEAIPTKNQRIITRLDGLRRLIALSKPEYVDALTLYMPITELDETGVLGGKTYYVANYLCWCFQGNRIVRVFQASEDCGSLRVFKCYLKGVAREVAQFLDFSNAQTGPQSPLSALDGPRVPVSRPLPQEVGWDLHVQEDGVWVAGYATALAGTDNDLKFSAIGTDVEHELTVNYQGRFPLVDISIAYIDPLASNQPLTVAVKTNDDDNTLLRTEAYIEVSLATDGDGNITSTANEIKAALEADSGVAQLITVEIAEGDGSGVVSAMAKTWITGWSERANANTSFWDRGY